MCDAGNAVSAVDTAKELEKCSHSGNSEKSQLAFTFKCLMVVVQARVYAYTCVDSESTSQQMDMLGFLKPLKLENVLRFCAEANSFTLESGFSPLKQLLQTLQIKERLLLKSLMHNTQKKEKKM